MRSLIVSLVLQLGVSSVESFSTTLPTVRQTVFLDRSDTMLQASRREVFSTVGSISSLVLVPVGRASDDGDMTSKMFNADGSLKDGTVEEAKQRPVEFKWDVAESGCLSVDGISTSGAPVGAKVKLFYEVPAKWSDGKDGDDIYYDRTEGTNAKACKRITVFQAPGTADIQQLQKATTIGVAKSLSVPDNLSRLYEADIISGRVKNRDGQTYYEFDMAAAPETCGQSDENLGLGFCPYDNIFLLSATIVDDRLYCIAVECDSTRIWKIASSDLKRVRSSFIAERTMTTTT